MRRSSSVPVLPYYLAVCVLLKIATFAKSSEPNRLALAAFVADTTLQSEDDFQVVLEIKNRSSSVVVISSLPNIKRVDQHEFHRVTPIGTPQMKEGQQVLLTPLITIVYPQGTQLRGMVITGKARIQYEPCGSNETKYVKLIIPPKTFQAGDCELVCSLIGGVVADSKNDIPAGEVVQSRVIKLHVQN